MLVNGLNEIRDLLATLITSGEIGTGTTTETKEDTDLETPLASTETTNNTAVTTSQQLVEKVEFLSTGGTGAITEMIWKDDSPEKAISRLTHASHTKTNEHDLIYETRWFFKGRFG